MVRTGGVRWLNGLGVFGPCTHRNGTAASIANKKMALRLHRKIPWVAKKYAWIFVVPFMQIVEFFHG